MEKIKIVLIEDREEFTGQVKTYFSAKEDYQLNACFPSIEEAFRSPKLNGADILLLDIGLPGISGISAIPELLMRNPELKIIMLTVFEDDRNLFAALKNGAVGYLLKGDCFIHLEQALFQVRNGGTLFSPFMAQKILRHFNRRFLLKTKLTKQEKNVLRMLGEGLTKKEIAEKLVLSYHTIDAHIKNMYRKLQVNSNVQAVKKANDEHLI
ncbi:MAG TPA: response regulator transcription factor [Prolixibacteraceae bacterium]|nr:response regulator transcription factor [Prolixibacteraceae bacterium]